MRQIKERAKRCPNPAEQLCIMFRNGQLGEEDLRALAEHRTPGAGEAVEHLMELRHIEPRRRSEAPRSQGTKRATTVPAAATAAAAAATTTAAAAAATTETTSAEKETGEEKEAQAAGKRAAPVNLENLPVPQFTEEMLEDQGCQDWLAFVEALRKEIKLDTAPPVRHLHA